MLSRGASLSGSCVLDRCSISSLGKCLFSVSGVYIAFASKWDCHIKGRDIRVGYVSALDISAPGLFGARTFFFRFVVLLLHCFGL